MLTYPRMIEELKRLNFITNGIANELATIRSAMTGRGISPDKSSLVEFKMQELENKLRKIAADLDNPIPF